MPRRVILHPGFHKTGTTTLQNTLRNNRAILAPRLKILLIEDIRSLCAATRRFSRFGDPLDLARIADDALTLAQNLQDHDGAVLISAEDLSGLIPGRDGKPGYDDTPKLMRLIADALRAVLPDTPLSVVFTTRTGVDWVNSCHAHHLRHTRMCLSRDDYVQKFGAGADLTAAVAAVAAALPDVDVQQVAVETAGDSPLGALDLMLNRAEIPDALRRRLTPAPRANRALSATALSELLAINLSAISDDDAARARRAINRGRR
tara:strand:+ start:9427 stop:10209 length:783 start_codon:yes stop_codon:yes gene_type:complete